MQSRENHASSSSDTVSDNDYVEITLDVRDDSVAVHSVRKARGEVINDSESALSARGLEMKTFTPGETSTRLSRTRQVSEEAERLRKVSEEINRLASSSTRPQLGEFNQKQSALRGLNFISKTDGPADWREVERRFVNLTMGTNGLLSRADFGKCIGMIHMPEDKKFRGFEPNHQSQDFAVQLFNALSQRQRNIPGGFINKAQLRDFWDQISDQSFDCRLQLFFDMIDNDDDGRITEEEVREIIALSASANILSAINKRADEYAALIMEELDPNNGGYIMIEDLEILLLKAPSHLVRGDESERKVLSRMLSQRLKPMSDSSPLSRWYENFKYFLLDNWQRVWVMALWIGVMAGLFAYKYIQYKNKAAFDVMGHCICMAKGAAETLKLNMALILLPVCRNTITWLRNKTRLSVAVPFSDNLNFHQIIAIAIAIGVGIHGISHLACDFPRLLHATEEEYEPMEKYFGDQPTSYWWFVKGVEGVTGIIMVVLMTIAFTLASPWFRENIVHLPKPFNKVTGFNAFWYSHHLFVIVYTLLIVHGIKLYLTKEWYKKTTWMYLAVPIVLYASERLLRAFRSSIKPIKILKVAVYPENVLALYMSKPDGFKYKSGQYMFVKCAAVSPFEWHPFFITSAPGDDYLSVHIRALGDWTRQLRTLFSEVRLYPTDFRAGPLRPEFLQGHNPNIPRVLIDGPYGAPSQEYKNYDVVLLVGLGIGATPMISIVKDIMNTIKAYDEMSSDSEDGANPLPPNGASPGTRKGGGNNFRTRKAYFYWVTREQGSFEWFKGIVDEVAEMDHQGVIDMQIYCTSVYEEGDARSAIITMLQSINLAKNGVDVVSGTRVKSHFGRPNWRKVYKHIAINHPNSKVGLFYCGQQEAAKELEQLALDFSHKTSTKFDFHKEKF